MANQITVKDLTKKQVEDIEQAGYDVSELTDEQLNNIIHEPFQIEAELDDGIGCKGGENVRLEINAYIGSFPDIHEFNHEIRRAAMRRYGNRARRSVIISKHFTN